MLEVRSDLSDNGYRLHIARRREGIFRNKMFFEPVPDWENGLAQLHPLTAAIIDELDYAKKLGGIDAQSRLLEFASAAELQNSDAALLNLLAPFPYQLDIQSRGTLNTANFHIQYGVTQGGVRVAGTFSEGIFSSGGQSFRIAGLLFSLLARIDQLNAEISSEGKMGQFAALRLLLPEEATDSNVHTEDYLLRIRIAHVTAISLKPSIAEGDVSFDPIPMRRVDPDDYEAGAELAITPLASEKFGDEFRKQRNVNSTYAIESGQYLYIDPSVRTALRVVKQKQTAPLEERMAFLMSPAKALTEAYRQAGVENEEIPFGDTIFYETAEYSDRITGIGEWIPPQLNYLESDQNNWLPERFSVVLSGKLVTGEPDDVPRWIEQVKAAMASKKEEVRLGDVQVPTNSPGLLATLQRLKPAESQPRAVNADITGANSEAPKRRIRILQTKNNFDISEFKRQLKPRQLGDACLPVMKARLKSHQEEGVSWLTDSYLSGWPGVLLADDMGLGKTLQSLSFLMILLRERVIRRGQPALVVASGSRKALWRIVAKRQDWRAFSSPLCHKADEGRRSKGSATKASGSNDPRIYAGSSGTTLC
jgi:hypothetical protein